MWTDEYLGLPWWEGGGDRNGVSCWGLAALVYRERCGTDLPAYSERMDAAERSVAAGEERELDLVTFAVKGMESHVGIVA
jgi:cell wall-associated NlpC family hydrolase